jgi:uncharacterized protein
MMKCPACATPLESPADSCPQCRFTLRRLDSKFGTLPLRNRYLTDRARSLSLDEISRLRLELQRFENKFPQSLFSVFLTDLDVGSNVREYAFWLANRAHFSSAESEAEENFDLLLVIDPKHRAAALTVGYGLEEYLPEEDLRETLAAAEPSLHKGQFERAIRICIDQMNKRLTRASRTAARASKVASQRASVDEW